MLCFGVNSFAQQTPHYTQYMYNMNILNPAYAGARADLSMSLLGRTQWVGIDGAPKTETFAINGRVLDGVGLGLSVVHDRIGLLEDTNVNLDISYTVVTGFRSRLAFGIKAGYAEFTNKLSQGLTPDNDVYGDLKNNYTNFGFGVFYYNKSFYAGLSIPQLFDTPKFKLEENIIKGLNESINYFVTAGVVLDVNENIKYKPSVLLKAVRGLPFSFDINSNILFKDRFELGVSYRYDDSVSGMIALNLNKQFRIGYAYDYTITNLGNYNSGSHEIMLLLDLDFRKKGRWLNDSSCFF